MVADAYKLLERVKEWKKARDDPSFRGTTSQALGHAVKVREAAMLDLFGQPWEQFSSADDQEGETLDLLQAMLEKFVGEEELHVS